MPFPRLIPCFDIAGGRVVKGVRFRNLVDMGDPVALGAAYSEGGADELVLLDVSATIEGRAPTVKLVARMAEKIAIPFTVGGGIRQARDAERLLEAGADKVSVNSAALQRPALIGELAALLGSQAVVVAIDAARDRVYSRSGSSVEDRTPAAWARESQERGAGEILLTSIDADGTRNGYDLATTRSVSERVTIPVIASGGGGSAVHVAAALEVAQAAVIASLVHGDPDRLPALRSELIRLGVTLRDVA
jgi:imidazole glycerol-phosphate synthase subunit HisF